MVKKEAVLHINTEDFIYPVERCHGFLDKDLAKTINEEFGKMLPASM